MRTWYLADPGGALQSKPSISQARLRSFTSLFSGEHEPDTAAIPRGAFDSYHQDRLIKAVTHFPDETKKAAAP